MELLSSTVDGKTLPDPAKSVADLCLLVSYLSLVMTEYWILLKMGNSLTMPTLGFVSQGLSKKETTEMFASSVHGRVMESN